MSILWFAIRGAAAHKQGMIGIVFPSHFEAVDLLARLDQKIPTRIVRDLPSWVGTIHKRDVAVGIIGMGLPHCAERTALFLQHYQPRTLILAGFAGALDPALKRGEVIINRGEGKIHTANEVIATAEEKARLLAAFGAPLVDMESAPVAAVADEHRVPLTVIRAVSDLANEDVPVAILSRSYNQARGVTTPVRLCFYLATHWGGISQLLNFLRPLSGVRRSLTRVLLAELN